MKKIVPILILISSIIACCKDKDICKETSIEVQPFFETTTKYRCNGDNEYTYILRNKEQVDSLQPNCFAVGPIAYPVDDANMAYITFGRLSYHNKDTFSLVALLKNPCKKKLTCEVNMIQRDTIVNCCPYGVGAVMNFFCSVENIPADYEVEVKYKYVPIQ